MSKVIHLETKVQTVFGVLDEDGNVVEKHPFNIDVPKHEEELFKEVVSVLKKTRSELTEKLENQNIQASEKPQLENLTENN